MTNRRQQIIDTLLSRVSAMQSGRTVTMPDGSEYTFAHDLHGVTVELGVAHVPESSRYAVAIRDAACDIDTSELGRNNCELDVEFHCAARNSDALATVRMLAQDILALLMSDRRLGGLCQTITASKITTPEAERNESVYASLILTVTIHYSVKTWEI